MFTALIGMLSFVSATQGWLLHRMSWPERLILLGGALLMIKPGWTTDIGGIAVLALVTLFQWCRGRRREARGEAGRGEVRPTAPPGTGARPALESRQGANMSAFHVAAKTAVAP